MIFFRVFLQLLWVMIGTGSSWGLMGKEFFHIALLRFWFCHHQHHSRVRTGILVVAYQVQIAVRKFYKSFFRQSSTKTLSTWKSIFQLFTILRNRAWSEINFNVKFELNWKSGFMQVTYRFPFKYFKGNFTYQSTNISINTIINRTWKKPFPGC